MCSPTARRTTPAPPEPRSEGVTSASLHPLLQLVDFEVGRARCNRAARRRTPVSTEASASPSTTSGSTTITVQPGTTSHAICYRYAGFPGGGGQRYRPGLQYLSARAVITEPGMLNLPLAAFCSGVPGPRRALRVRPPGEGGLGVCGQGAGGAWRR